MRKLLIAVITVVLTACGVQGKRGETGPQGPQGESGQDGAPCQDVSINGLCKSPSDDEEEEDEPLSFEGEYYLPYSGFAIINIDHEGRYTVNARYETLNPDDSLCVLTLNGSNLTIHNDRIVYGAGVNMVEDNCDSDAGDDLETDAPDTTYRHETTLEFDEDGFLTAHLLVFETDDNETNLVINRELVEE